MPGFFRPASAQFYEPSGKTVRMGESLPGSFYQTVHQAVNVRTGNSTAITLDRYRDKLLILDFWATWCGPCIYSLNKLDSLKAAMNDTGYVVVPVTYQRAEEAAPAFERFGWDMTSIVSDTVLSRIFPHSSIPHQVWIRDGRVIAMPQWHYATAENIARTARGETVAMRNSLRSIDVRRPFFIDGNGDAGTLLYQSVISGGDPAFRQHKLEFVCQDSITVLATYNVPARLLFYYAFKPAIHPKLDGEAGAGILLEVGDSLLAELTEQPPRMDRYASLERFQQDYDKWVQRKWYSYSLRAPHSISREEALGLMREEVNRFFGRHLGIEGVIEKRPKQVAVLRLLGSRAEAEERLKTGGGKMFMDLARTGTGYRAGNVRLSAFKTVIGMSKAVPDAIITDSTGIGEDFRADFSLPGNIQGNLGMLRKALNRYGLDLQLEEKWVPVLVIREIPGNQERVLRSVQ